MNVESSQLLENEEYLHFLSRDYLYRRDVLGAFLNLFTDLTQSEIGYLHLVDESQNEIELAVWSDNVFSNCTTGYATHYPVSKAGIWADSIRKKTPVLHNDYGHMNNDEKQGLPDGHFAVNRHLSIPVMYHGRIEAVIGIGNRSTSYTEKEVEIWNGFIQEAWKEIKIKITDVEKREFTRLQQYKKMKPESSLIKVIAAMSDALELRDEYTSMHQRNVSLLSNKIANKLDLNERQVEGVTIGALVHDIGKIGVPSQILNKMKALTDAEFELVKQHPSSGAKLFKSIDLPMPLFDMVEQHHERLDGSGYPHGLKGNDICIEARIIAVADTFDAMASDRPYRYSPGRQAAIDELKSNRNIKYDAYVVDSFLEVIETDPDLKPGVIYK
ncbi:MAG: HD domain-containing protein [Gammaproteobacteria bacterium]|nr:HD domain-containing protein [Gammaproteobacteria bacterium]